MKIAVIGTLTLIACTAITGGNAPGNSLPHITLTRGNYTFEDGDTTFGGILDYRVTAGHVQYYVVGSHITVVYPDSYRPPNGFDVPYLPVPASGWGRRVDHVQLGVAIEPWSVPSGGRILGQVTIDNQSGQNFDLYSGCGPNIQLRLPDVDDSHGHSVPQNFTIGQNICAATTTTFIPPKTTANFIFNIAELYDIKKPGRYTLKIVLDNPPDSFGGQQPTMTVKSATIPFVVTAK